MAGDSVILEHLRAIRSAVERNGERLDHLTYRVSSVESQVASLQQQVGGLRADLAHYSNQ